MAVEIDNENLSASCKADTRWAALSKEARERGFFVPVQPLSDAVKAGEWLMGGLPSMGALRYGPPCAAVRRLELTTGAGTEIRTGFPALSDFASSSNLSALLLGSGGELGRLSGATFKLVPLGRMHAVTLELPAGGLVPLVSEMLSKVPALYHIEFGVRQGRAVLRAIVQGEEALCALAMSKLEGLAAGAGAGRSEAPAPYLAASGAGEWHLPLGLVGGALPELAAAAEVAGIVERGRVRLKATPPEGMVKAWAEQGHLELRARKGPGEAGPLPALVKQVFDPHGSLNPKGPLAAEARKLEEAPAPPLFNLRPRMPPEQQEELRELIGEGNVTFDEYDRMVCSHDLAPLPREVEVVFRRLPDAIVLARNAEDVAKLVRFAQAHDIPLVPRGGASWGFGGCVPTQGGIVVDLSFMMGIEIGEGEQLAVCGPGATWKQVIDAAAKKGLTVGAYPGSYPVATVAGWLSTNGAGLCSYRYGTAYDQVAWVEAVLADATVVSTRDGPFDLTALFAGAEGTLGIITKVAVRLRPSPEASRPVAYAVDSVEALVGPLVALTRSPLEVLHIALFDGAHFRYQRLLGKHAPEIGGMLLAVLEGTAESVAEEERLLDALMKGKGAEKLPSDVAEHEWEERLYELRARRLGPGGVLGEAVVPAGAFGAVAADIRVVARELGMQTSINGVVVDRNTVALMPYFITDERTMLRSLGGAMGFVKKIVDAGMAHGGRPSGLGIFFAGNLDKMHAGPTAGLISDIKDTLDPHHVINPGKHTEMGTRFGIPIPSLLLDYGMALMAVLKRGMHDRLPEGEELRERLKGAKE